MVAPVMLLLLFLLHIGFVLVCRGQLFVCRVKVWVGVCMYGCMDVWMERLKSVCVCVCVCVAR